MELTEKQIETTILSYMPDGMLWHSRNIKTGIADASHVIFERLKQDVVWEEYGYVFINEGCVEFDFPEMNHLGEGELLAPCKDGEQLQVIMRKVKDAGQGSADNP